MTAESLRACADIERRDGFRFEVTFPDIPAAAALTMDEPRPLGDDNGPNPAALLAAAVGGCLAASVTFCLRKARVEPDAVMAHAEARLIRNETGRFRIGDILVDLQLRVPEADEATLARCTSLFEDFCIVTESVRRGVPVTVRLQTADVRPASSPVPA